MKKKLIIGSIFLLLTATLWIWTSQRPISDNLNAGDTGLTVLGFVKIEAEHRNNPASEPVAFTFYYGHELSHPESFVGLVFILEVYLRGIYSEDMISIGTVTIDNLLTESNACDIRYLGYWQYYSDCPNSYEYYIDFLDYGILEGYVYYRITQVGSIEDSDDDFENQYEEVRLRFSVEGERVYITK